MSILSIFRRAKSLEEGGQKIIHMEVGEPDFMPPEEAGRALHEACRKGLVRYGQAGGMAQFRGALSQYASKKFDARVNPENILASPGARFSVFAAITTLLDPGDEIIIIEPAWPAYRECALHAGIKVRTVSTTLEERWEPSMQQISDMITGNTKMIVLNYPNNPTGKILPARLQDEILSTARDSGLYVLSDEIYSDYAYSDWKSILSYGYEKSIVTQSFSKSHAMTGFRIGYAVSSEETIGKMAGIAALCLTSVAEPIQYAAIRATQADTAGNSEKIRGRLDLLSEMAKDAGLEFARPDGAMYLYARTGIGGFDGGQFADSLLDRGLAIAPGAGFGNYKNFIRISACQDENVLMQGMSILSDRLDEMR